MTRLRPPQAESKAWRRGGINALIVIAILSTVAIGTTLRLEDPMSTPVIPAEDPYTHMALIREHLVDGSLDPLYQPGHLYPPGMHAYLASFWVFTGMELYDIIRFGPVAFGALSVLGVAFLVGRHAGWIAGFVSGMAMAVAPEALFRTSMMAPTAVDLAIVPFLLYALLHVMRGRLAWTGVAAPLSAFLLLAHPWFLAILAIAGAAFLVLALTYPWSRRAAPPMDPRGLGWAAAIIGSGFGLSLYTGPGFGQILQLPQSLDVKMTGQAIIAASFLPLLATKLAPDHVKRLVSRQPARRGLVARLLASAVLAVALVAVTMPAIENGMPEHVDLPRMFGAPILALAAVAFVTLPFITRPIGHLGAAIAVSTYPFVIYNPFNSPYWPHRTAVYLGIGLVVLVGIVVGAIAHLVIQATRRALEARQASKAAGGTELRIAGVVSLGALFVATAFAGTIYAATPVAYETGWYRLYHECELDAMKDVADSMEQDPTILVLASSWQAKLVIGSLITDQDRVWTAPTVYIDPDERERVIWEQRKDGHKIVFLVEKHVRAEHPEADASFLQYSPYTQEDSWCANQGTGKPLVTTYVMEDQA